MRMRAMAIAVLVLVCALAGFARAGHELNAAVLAGNESKIREIIESGREGIDHKEEGKEGMTALFFATLLDKPDMVRHLMKEYNANPLIGDAKNYTPMDVGTGTTNRRIDCPSRARRARGARRAHPNRTH